MNYDIIDADRTAKEVIKGRIVDTAVVAYSHELELRRLKAHVDNGDESAKAMLAQAAETATRHRRRAERAAGSDTTIPSIERAIRDGLLDRMRQVKAQVEATHAHHSQLQAERERILALDDADPYALTDAERSEVEANVAIHGAYIRDCEVTHRLVTADIEALEAQMVPEEQPPDTSDQDIADALAAAEGKVQPLRAKPTKSKR